MKNLALSDTETAALIDLVKRAMSLTATFCRQGCARWWGYSGG
jgi:hypothetical protein